MAEKEQLLFEAKLDIAEAAKRAAELQEKLATLIERRELLTQQRKKLASSLKLALQAEKEAIASKEALRKKVDELNAAEGDNSAEVAKLTAEIASLSDTQREARAAAEKYSSELAVTESNLKDVRSAIRETEKDFKAFPGTLQDQRNELARLKKEYANFRVGIDGTEADLEELTKQVRELNDAVSEQEQKVGVFSRNVGNYTDSIKQAFNELPGPVGRLSGMLTGLKDQIGKLKALGPIGLAVAGVAAIGAATAAVIKYGVELDKTREKVRQFSGEEGESLDKLTASVTATSSVFNQEAGEIVQASNAFFREFQDLGVKTQEEASKLIRQGFAAGADASGEFLDTLKEYPSQLREIGLTGSEAIALISQQPETGVFADKGIDSIKEAALRIRELPDATRDALDQIGIDSKKIEEELRSGQTTTFEVIQKVSEKLSEFPPQSREVGTAIADIFGSAGEDAGLRYLQTLKDIDLNLDQVVKDAGGMAEANLRISDATERINLQFTRLFSGSNETFASLKADALEFVANGLEKLINGVIALANYFIDLYNESTLVRGVWEGLKAVGKTLFEGLKAQAKSFFSFFKSAGRVIGAVLKGEFSSIPEILREGREERAEVARQAGEKIGEAWSTAYKNTVNREKVEFISLSSDEVSDVESQYKKAGERAAKAFSEGMKSGEESKVKKKINVEAVQNVDFAEINSVAIDLEKLAAENNERLKLDKSYYEQRLEEQKLALEKEKAELDLFYDGTDEERKAREEQLNNDLREIRRQQLEFQLIDLREGSTEALNIELELLALRKEAKDEELEEDRKRLEAAKKLEEERARLARIGLQGVIDSTQGIVDAFGEQSKAGKAAIAIQKAATAAQIGINLKEQISNAITTGSEIAKTIPAGPILGTIYTAGAIAGYTLQAGNLLAELAGFERGGDTSSGGDRLYINDKGQIVNANNLTFEGTSVSSVGAFAGGGGVNRPTLGLIGERGPEYVVPNRVLKTEEGQRHVYRLEEMRKNMISRFELGGFTSAESSQTRASTTDFSATDRETVRLIQRLVKIERQLEEQNQISDTNSERRRVIDQVRESALRLQETATSNNSSTEGERQRAEFISRQLEAIKQSQLSEMLYSSFSSRDEESISRAEARSGETIQRPAPDNREFVASPLLVSQEEATVSELVKLNSMIESREGITTRQTLPEGVVSSPVIAPIQSPSYVIPNFVLDSPAAKESIRAIEEIRRTTAKASVPNTQTVTPFAVGGPGGGIMPNDTFSQNQPVEFDLSPIVEAIEGLPAPIVLVEDIQTGINNKVNVETESGI